MKNHLINKMAVLTFLTLVSACSDDKQATSSPPTSSTSTQTAASSSDIISKDSPTDPTPEAEPSQKEKFREDFSAQCVERELNSPQNASSDADKMTKACNCIAEEVMKDLTDEEAEKYLKEHELPQSIRIKYEAAAYECLQEKVKPEEPKIIKYQ